MENFYWPHLQLHPYLPPTDYHPPPPFAASEEDRAATASRSHSEAEKRRRDRINAQLATLRKLIPKSEKMDKAALLGHVVEHVKEQSQRAKEVGKTSTIPTEIDEVIIDHLNAEAVESTSTSQIMYMKASICCDDRPEFFAEMNSALKGIGATIAKAEITSLGGRMKASFVLSCKEQNALQHSLKMALSRVIISSGSTYTARSKRQRFFYPTSH